MNLLNFNVKSSRSSILSSSLESLLGWYSLVRSVKSFMFFGRWFMCSSSSKELISYVINEPISSSNRNSFRSLVFCIVVTLGSHLFGMDLKILLVSSKFKKHLLRLFKLLTTSVKWVYISLIVSLGAIRKSSKSCIKRITFEFLTLLVPSCMISSVCQISKADSQEEIRLNSVLSKEQNKTFIAFAFKEKRFFL
ncbi:unnamed protein product [Musa textilis]